MVISSAKHGPAGHRQYRYEPIFLLRGLTELHIEFTPVDRAPESTTATTSARCSG